MRKMITYGEIYKQFTEKYPDLKAVDYRPLTGDLLPKDSVGITIWLENGDTIAYILEVNKQ